ncbi:MAG: hypothetical protein JSU01_05515 [Bacteroidetes bacterium]|nr:hypothetical protein [Bacteroidota bacterium]
MNAKELKKAVALTGLLQKLGHNPVRTSGADLIYLGMLPGSGSRPAFAVNPELNVWYDHTLGKGGNLIDFAMAYWQSGFLDAFKKICALTGHNADIDSTAKSGRRRHAVRLPHYQVEYVKPLGNNFFIQKYLVGLGIWEIAQSHLSEIYYFVEDEKQRRKHFFAAGIQNELGSWEVQSLNFCGSLGHKAMTIIPGDTNRLAVFENFVNYLSWLVVEPGCNCTVLILNTLTVIFAAARKAGEFEQVAVYLDRTEVGFKATSAFLTQAPGAYDASGNYKGYANYNEMLRRTTNQSAFKR